MRGTYEVNINSKRLQYKFIIDRKITIVRGDSGSGKTTLAKSIDKAGKEGVSTVINSKVPVIILKYTRHWKEDIRFNRRSIIIIDEGFLELESHEFAREIKNSDSYFIIITRKKLPNLPYSIHSVYNMRRSGKFNIIEPSYKDIKYGNKYLKPNLIITEDSKSGYQFFSSISKYGDIKCISAKGKTNIKKTLMNYNLKGVNSNILLVADGAAFGGEMIDIMEDIKSNTKDNILLYLTESFEYLLLNSPMILDNCTEPNLITSPSHWEETDYFSRELYFEALLKDIVKGTPASYNKKKLPSCFTERCCHLLGKENETKVPCKFQDLSCRTDLDKILSILEYTGIDFSRIIGTDPLPTDPHKIKGF